ncbi:MAG: ATP-binding protein [Parvularculaceae bacterium]
MMRLLRTTAFRFTIAYVFVFSVAVAILGLIVYRATFGAFDRQTDQLINQDLRVIAQVFTNDGAGALRRVVGDRAAWRDDGLYMLIAAPTGAVLTGNLTALPNEALVASNEFFDFTYERERLDAASRNIGVETRTARGRMQRFQPSEESQTSFLVFVARDVSRLEQLRGHSKEQMAKIGAATIALGLLIAVVFSRSLLRRVDAVTRTAKAIRDGDLSKRIALNGTDDEIDNLSMNLNAMLDQIERLMSGMREVSDNIAHDLRSPLTRMRARLDDAVNATPAEKEEALRATREDAERMIATFNALLSIARIESGEGAGAMEEVDLVAIAEEMAELYEPAAQDAGFVLELDASPAPPVRGSRALIGQALANMLDNALKYAVGGSVIKISVHGPAAPAALAPAPPAAPGVAGPLNAMASLAVADDGPGIPEADRENVLRRYVRLERSRSTPGSGLGLSLVAAIARAHGASLSLAHTFVRGGAPRGLTLTLSFRAQRPARKPERAASPRRPERRAA